MKTFLYRFFTLRWWTIIRSIFVDEDVLIMEQFMANPPQLFSVTAKRGVDRKKLIKSMKHIIKGVDVLPNGINLFAALNVTAEEIVDKLLETGSIYIALPGKSVTIIEEAMALGGSDRVDHDNFIFRMQHEWDVSMADQMEEAISTAWYATLVRQGRADKCCPECDNEHFLDIDAGFCKYCHNDYTMTEKVPDTPAKMFKQVLAYETSTGKEILARVA